MDINLPLILFIAVLLSGLGWLYDLLFLRRARMQAVAAIEQRYAELDAEKRASNADYQISYSAASHEPAFVEYSKSFFPVLLIVFVLRSFVVEPFQIPSESMLPTLLVGDFIVVSKFSYGIRLPIIRSKVVSLSEPERGDVMVFFPPEEKRYFIKRVIGLPGDTIRLVQNRLYINDEEVERRYVSTEIPVFLDACTGRNGSFQIFEETLGEHTHEIRLCSLASSPGERIWTVPEGHYFMMGDNRDNSSDSRVWGFVPDKNIVGKAFAIWMHWDKFFSIPSFSRVGKIE